MEMQKRKKNSDQKRKIVAFDTMLKSIQHNRKNLLYLLFTEPTTSIYRVQRLKTESINSLLTNNYIVTETIIPNIPHTNQLLSSVTTS